MGDIWQMVTDWTGTLHAPLSAALLLTLAALPFFALRAWSTRARRDRIKSLTADTAAASAIWSLRGTPGNQARRALSKLYASEDAASIAVLPFEERGLKDIEPDLAKRLAEDMVGLLTLMQNVDVTTLHYERDTHATLGSILPVTADYVLEGSVEMVRGGPHPGVRVVAQIVEVATGESVFADSFEGPVRGFGSLEDDIAESVAATLGSVPRMTPDPDFKAAPTESLAAWALMERGNTALRTGMSRQRIDEAVRVYGHAARIDPAFGDAKAALASALSLRILFLTSPAPEDDISVASAALAAAKIISDETIYTAVAQGLTDFASGNLPSAKAAFEHAHGLTPNGNAAAAIYRDLTALHMGHQLDMSEVRDILETTEEAALRTMARYAVGLDLAQRGDFEAVAELMKQSVTGVRAFGMSWLLAGLARALAGEHERANGIFAQSRRIMGPVPDHRIRDWVGAAAATPERARQWLDAFDRSWR